MLKRGFIPTCLSQLLSGWHSFQVSVEDGNGGQDFVKVYAHTYVLNYAPEANDDSF